MMEELYTEVSQWFKGLSPLAKLGTTAGVLGFTVLTFPYCLVFPFAGLLLWGEYVWQAGRLEKAALRRGATRFEERDAELPTQDRPAADQA